MLRQKGASAASQGKSFFAIRHAICCTVHNVPRPFSFTFIFPTFSLSSVCVTFGSAPTTARFRPNMPVFPHVELSLFFIIRCEGFMAGEMNYAETEGSQIGSKILGIETPI
jgi:hypothetical protein